MADISSTQGPRIVITLDVHPRGIVIGATVNGRFNAGYAPRPAERIPGEVQALVAEILDELRAQSLLGS